MTMEYYDANNVTFKSCLSYGTVFFDGFRNDLFFKTFHPEYFGPEPTVPEPQRTKQLNKITRSWARAAKLKIMAGTDILCLAQDNGECVATCFSSLPVQDRIQLNWWQWLKYKSYQVYVKVADFIDGNPVKELRTSEFQRFFGAMYTEGGAIEGPEYYAKLAEMSHDELAKTRYPHKETFYVNILAVRSDCHGKGYGPKLLLWTIDQVQHLKGPIFTSGDKKSERGPAKASLFPTTGNETFYNKLGFQTVSSAVVPLVGDQTYEHKFMQRFLVNEIDV